MSDQNRASFLRSKNKPPSSHLSLHHSKIRLLRSKQTKNKLLTTHRLSSAVQFPNPHSPESTHARVPHFRQQERKNVHLKNLPVSSKSEAHPRLTPRLACSNKRNRDDDSSTPTTLPFTFQLTSTKRRPPKTDSPRLRKLQTEQLHFFPPLITLSRLVQHSKSHIQNPQNASSCSKIAR